MNIAPIINTAIIVTKVQFRFALFFINNNKGQRKLITRLRILIGSIVAILGSLTMDEVIFKNDIDNMMQTYKVEGVDSIRRMFGSSGLHEVIVC